MSIIKPARSFENSNLDSNGTTYIKPAIPQLNFGKNGITEGAYVVFLPAYKLDNYGNGCWFRQIKIRDNFGDKFKSKYVVDDIVGGTDPSHYFAANYSIHYPEKAVVTEVSTARGKTKAYPFYGRTTNRVLFNTLLYSNMESGVHLLDLPAGLGASELEKYHNTKDISGNLNSLVCDSDQATPVFIKLVMSSPPSWQITPAPQNKFKIPDKFCDTAALINLDEATIKVNAADIVQQLREMFSPEEFDTCMRGYPGLVSSYAAKPATQQPTQLPRPQVAPIQPPVPTLEPPKSVTGNLSTEPKVNTPPLPTLPIPTSGSTSSAKDDLRAFLES